MKTATLPAHEIAEFALDTLILSLEQARDRIRKSPRGSRFDPVGNQDALLGIVAGLPSEIALALHAIGEMGTAGDIPPLDYIRVRNAMKDEIDDLFLGRWQRGRDEDASDTAYDRQREGVPA